MIRRVLAVLGLCVGVLVGVVSPSDAATVTPAPYPTNGGAASSWSCTYTGGDPTTPATGQDCAVTAWVADPAPAPVTLAPGEPISGTVSVAAEQYAPLVFGLGVLVMLTVAGFIISQARPPTFGAPSILGRGRR